MNRRTMAGALALITIMCCCLSLTLHAHQPPAGTAPPTPPAGASAGPQKQGLDDTYTAGDDEVSEPARKLVNWNEYEGKYFTIRFGAGFLYEYASFAQDDDSKEQVELHSQPKLRDARFLFSGRIKSSLDRPITWSTGIMWDAPTKKFLFRQTQIVVAVPEIWGYITVGRTKEGISLNKVMAGYAGWTMERATISDATIPILADGIKWIGYAPERHFLWNLGFYIDALSEGQTFSTYDHQAVGRFAWVPVMSEEEVLHIGLNLRYGKPNEGELQLRSRPEAFPATFVVDTGKYPVKDTRMAGIEAYYRPGPLLMGTEYYFQKQNSPEKQNPLFHGGDMFVSWLPTGEVRPYNTRGGYFDQISPNRTVFEGGPGAWELVARLSFIDLDSGPVRGGKFWRFTPMVNWFLSDNVRLEFEYGYGSLDRFDLVGKTQFFQSRMQLQF